MKIHDIEIDKIKLKVNFIMDNGIKYKNKIIDSVLLSDTTITKIFDDLSKLNPKTLKEEK
jgi:hypothetical protein